MFTQHMETSPVIGQSPRSAAEARADHSSAIELLEAELLYDALVAGVDGNAQLAAMTGSAGPSGSSLPAGSAPEGEYSAESSSIAMQLLDQAMFEEHPTLPPPPPGVPHGATLDGEDRRR